MSEIELCHLQEKTYEFRRVQTVHVNSPKEPRYFFITKICLHKIFTKVLRINSGLHSLINLDFCLF